MHERRRRSVAKAISWRFFATTDTILLALIFTGSAAVALSIGGLEIITKSLWYYLHERAWLLPAAQPHGTASAGIFGHDAHLRSVAKAFTWRFIGALDTFFISLIITGRLVVSGSIGGTELITKVVLYYLHERLWLHIKWGHIPTENEPESPLHPHVREALDIIKHYYHVGAAIFYGVLCVLAIIVLAATIYVLHST